MLPGGATWHEAYAYCGEIGKKLLAIESEEENDVVENYLQQIGGN